jgi:hypothetical protein
MFGLNNISFSQNCGTSQNLSQFQESQINTILTPLDSALKQENLFQIDSLSLVLKNIYSTQAGIPDVSENYFNLTNSTNWLPLQNAIDLSRLLISADSLTYVNLWKSGLGMSPPNYQPHSLFLRAPAEIAAGLLKIASRETDINRKTLYQNWAIKTLDSLLTKQLPNGAFPFPDLRTYNDATFSSIIQNFMIQCGTDSVDVLQNGWIIDDKETGEFKFDAGIIANAFYEAYKYTGNIAYKNCVISIGNYLKPLKFNLNYNYNTFVSLGLTRAYQLTNDASYLERAIKNIRYSVQPGQITNGRWVDGHNANSRYHNLIIQNISPTISLLTDQNNYKIELDQMTKSAVENLIDYSTNCGSATGYRWLMKAYSLNSSLFYTSTIDSISKLIGQHINQSSINGKYLDVPTMGDYFELLDFQNNLSETNELKNSIMIYPNPTNEIINISLENKCDSFSTQLFDVNGRLIQESKNKNEINLYDEQKGIYFLKIQSGKVTSTFKIIKFEL